MLRTYDLKVNTQKIKSIDLMTAIKIYESIKLNNFTAIKKFFFFLLNIHLKYLYVLRVFLVMSARILLFTSPVSSSVIIFNS